MCSLRRARNRELQHHQLETRYFLQSLYEQIRPGPRIGYLLMVLEEYGELVA